MVGVSIAMWITRWTSAFHSAVRGADFFTDGFFAVGCNRSWPGMKPLIEDGSKIETLVQYGLAGFGLWFQIFSGFSLPWILSLPLKLILFPLYLVEGFLGTYAVWG